MITNERVVESLVVIKENNEFVFIEPLENGEYIIHANGCSGFNSKLKVTITEINRKEEYFYTSDSNKHLFSKFHELHII